MITETREPVSYTLLIPSGNQLILGARCVVKNPGRVLTKRQKEPAKLWQPRGAGEINLDFRAVKASRT